MTGKRKPIPANTVATVDLDSAISNVLEKILAKKQEEQEADAPDDISAIGPRYVFITGIIESTTIKDVAERLAYFNAVDPTRPITAVVASEGGLAVYGWALHDILATNDLPVLTIGYGIICSAGTIAFLGGRHRLISPNTTFIIHSRTREPEPKGHTTEMFRELADTGLLEDEQMERLYVTETKRPLAEVRSWMGKETRFTAKEALNLGFADEMLHFHPRSKKGNPAKKQRPTRRLKG